VLSIPNPSLFRRSSRREGCPTVSGPPGNSTVAETPGLGHAIVSRRTLCSPYGLKTGQKIVSKGLFKG
jgi:hypothetical protein